MRLHSAHREARGRHPINNSQLYIAIICNVFFLPPRPTSGQQRVLLARGNWTKNVIIKQTPSALFQIFSPSDFANLLRQSAHITRWPCPSVRRVFVFVRVGTAAFNPHHVRSSKVNNKDHFFFFFWRNTCAS